MFTKIWELEDIFIYGPVRVKRNKEMDTIFSGKILLEVFKYLTIPPAVLQMDVIYETPVWFNPNLKIDFTKKYLIIA